MGWFDRFRHAANKDSVQVDLVANNIDNITAAAIDNQNEYVHTYDNRNITFTGDLSDYDYDTILRDKQNNINSLYELSDY